MNDKIKIELTVDELKDIRMALLVASTYLTLTYGVSDPYIQGLEDLNKRLGRMVNERNN